METVGIADGEHRQTGGTGESEGAAVAHRVPRRVFRDGRHPGLQVHGGEQGDASRILPGIHAVQGKTGADQFVGQVPPGEHRPGVDAVVQAESLAGRRLRRGIAAGEAPVLFLGEFLPAPLVGHGEVGEGSFAVQVGQGHGRGQILRPGPGEAGAAHPRVDLQMDLQRPGQGRGIGFGFLQAPQSLGQIQGSQGISPPGRGGTQEQDGGGDPRRPELGSLVQAGHRQVGTAQLLQPPGNLHVPVAVGIRLHHPQAPGSGRKSGRHGFEIVPDPVQADLRPGAAGGIGGDQVPDLLARQELQGYLLCQGPVGVPGVLRHLPHDLHPVRQAGGGLRPGKLDLQESPVRPEGEAVHLQGKAFPGDAPPGLFDHPEGRIRPVQEGPVYTRGNGLLPLLPGQVRDAALHRMGVFRFLPAAPQPDPLRRPRFIGEQVGLADIVPAVSQQVQQEPVRHADQVFPFDLQRYFVHGYPSFREFPRRPCAERRSVV